jgi:hypothetical protein
MSISDEQWKKMKENGRKKGIKNTLLDSFDKLGENEQDEYYHQLMEDQKERDEQTRQSDEGDIFWYGK